MTRGRSTRLALAIMAAVVASDQAVKAIVKSSIQPGEVVDVIPGLELVNVRNSGVAFGLFAGGGALVPVLVAAALIALVAFFLAHTGRPLVWLPVGLLMGGAAGNLIDRVVQGSVTDFIDPALWPAFNVADIAITTGVVTLLYVMEGPPRRREREAHARPDAAAPDDG